MYRITWFCTHIHDIIHNIGIYLIRVILFGHMHNDLGEKTQSNGIIMFTSKTINYSSYHISSDINI